jgi:hypothetical protein
MFQIMNSLIPYLNSYVYSFGKLTLFLYILLFYISYIDIGQVVANFSKLYPMDMESPEARVDDMTKLAYLHEPGVLHNLATRFEINEIYVRLPSASVFYQLIFTLERENY